MFLAIVAIICIQGILLAGLFGKVLFQYGIHALEKRVDVRLSLVNSATESQRASLVEKLQTLPHITEIRSVSATAIYNEFQSRHATDFLTLQALKELNGNPFGTELVIRLDSPSSQAEFINQLKDTETLSAEQQSVIEDVDAIHNDILVSRLQSFKDTAIKVGGATSLLVFVVVFLILSVVSRMFLNEYAVDIAVMRTYGVGEGYIGGWLSATYTICVIVASVITLLGGSLLMGQFDNFVGSLGAGAMVQNWYQSNLLYITGFVVFTSLCIIHLMVMVFLHKKKK